MHIGVFRTLRIDLYRLSFSGRYILCGRQPYNKKCILELTVNQKRQMGVLMSHLQLAGPSPRTEQPYQGRRCSGFRHMHTEARSDVTAAVHRPWSIPTRRAAVPTDWPAPRLHSGGAEGRGRRGSTLLNRGTEAPAAPCNPAA